MELIKQYRNLGWLNLGWLNLGWLYGRLCFVAAVMTLSGALINDAAAQAVLIPSQSESSTIPTKIDEPASKEAVRELVSKLDDDAVRSLLIERLDAVAAAKSSDATNSVGFVALTRDILGKYLVHVKDTLRGIPEIPNILSKTGSALQQSIPVSWREFMLKVLAAVAMGFLAERVVATGFRKDKQRLIQASSTELWGILKLIYTRLSYDILGVLAFRLVSFAAISYFFEPQTIAHGFAMVVPGTIAGGWMAYVICRFFFAPRRPDLRICNTTDQRAMRITLSFSLVAAYIVFIHAVFPLMMSIGNKFYNGPGYMFHFGFWMNISMYVAAAIVVWYNRAGLVEILLENKKRVSVAIGDEAPNDLSWFAVHWPAIAMFLLACKYLLVEIVVGASEVGVYSIGAVYITFTFIFLWPGVDANVSLFVAKGITPAEDETESAGKARRNMQQGLLRVGRILVVGVVVYSLASLWGLNLMDLAHSSLGAQAAGTLIEFLFIVLVAYICWELISALIGHWLALEGGHAEESGDSGGEIGGVGLSRVATLLPIIRKTAQFLVIVVSIIMVLDNWGINTGPILAGAGVVGLAIGFGAQTLVKDIVSGLFFLADDAFRVGEYIDVGGTMGNVEKISLRSLRLRHHKGLVHTIPYGEIPKLTNFSRDWVIVKLRFRVPFDTDIHKVKKIFKGIGADLITDPILGEDFLQPFKSQGVAEVDDNGIIVRGKFMAKPGKQFMIRKEVYVRVQKAFEEAGIPFARKQVMVHIPGLEKTDELGSDQLKAVGAAAAEAADEESAAETEKR